MLHLPILRGGRPYRSLDVARLPHVRTGEPVCEVSRANPGLVARDLGQAAERRRELERLGVHELLDVCRRAGELFAEGDLPVGHPEGAVAEAPAGRFAGTGGPDADSGTPWRSSDDGPAARLQSPQQYVEQLSSTTGMPWSLCRQNVEKIHYVLENMERVLDGLTRGLDLEILDRGWGRHGDSTIGFVPEADALGVVLPSNSPGVHSLWIPSIALKVPVILKPGGREPWTPYRVAQALLAAGCPPGAVGYYPTSYSGATEILLRCSRSMIFGDASTVGAWADDPGVQLHGPGRSKVIFGADAVGRWEEHLDLLVESVSSNGGRSCINASGVWLPADGAREAGRSPPRRGSTADRLSRALAERLTAIEPRPLDDPGANLAAFAEPSNARRISDHIDRQLERPGARDVSARLRRELGLGVERLVEVDGCTYLRPTVIHCSDPDHPLAAIELLFPFVAVVEAPARDLSEAIGPTLVATALTDDDRLRSELLDCRLIERLNLGPIPTSRVAWDQPHEGNLFEHLYRQRALQSAPAASGA